MNVEEMISQQLGAISRQTNKLAEQVAIMIGEQRQKETNCQRDREEHEQLFDRLREAEMKIKLLEKQLEMAQKEKEIVEETEEKVETKAEKQAEKNWKLIALLVGGAWAVISKLIDYLPKLLHLGG